MTMGNPRVFDGQVWTDVTVESFDETATVQPVPPAPDGDGSIFVSVVSYRDGERCGVTIQSIFENAAHPDKIVIGLVEHAAPEDKFCMEAYCELYGLHDLRREFIRSDMTKVIVRPFERSKCPRYDQVRKLAVHHIDAKGPMYARSLVKKVLGNEEFCMQVDAHTKFVKNWDDLAITDWKATNNEFAVISTIPARSSDQQLYYPGSSLYTTVPRICAIEFRDNGFPDFLAPADGKVADLNRPLLSYGWSSAFSFSKCHLEESAPYDPFANYAMPVEQFSRFARFWTRGYDSYTPTRNIVFHTYGTQENGHGNNEWFQRQRDRFRQECIKRAKTIVQLPDGDPSETAQANLGIYGLGKRRTIQQLIQFTYLDVVNSKGTYGYSGKCLNNPWIPYDASISPVANLYDKADNLDPQPLFPLRTKLIYYNQDSEPRTSSINLDLKKDKVGRVHHVMGASINQLPTSTQVASNMPSGTLLFILWVFGLVAWYVLFMNPQLLSSVIKLKKVAEKSAKAPRKKSVMKDV